MRKEKELKLTPSCEETLEYFRKILLENLHPIIHLQESCLLLTEEMLQFLSDSKFSFFVTLNGNEKKVMSQACFNEIVNIITEQQIELFLKSYKQSKGENESYEIQNTTNISKIKNQNDMIKRFFKFKYSIKSKVTEQLNEIYEIQ